VMDPYDAPIFTSLGVKIGLCYRFHVLSGAKTRRRGRLRGSQSRRRPSREKLPPQIVSLLELHIIIIIPRSH